jgi:hypothetical protein
LTSRETPPPSLRPHGSDRVEAGADRSVWLVCAAPKGWTPRRGRAHTPGEYPGTAVRWGTGLFEVVEAIAQLDGTVRYRLEPWPDRHVVRAIQSYEAGTEAARRQERTDHDRNIARRRLARVLSPLLGHLPGPVQERMEGQFGAPAVAMTVASALPLFALGFVSSLFSLAAAFGEGFSVGMSGLENARRSIPHLLPVPLAVYLVVESGIRMGVAFHQARPIGSLPGTLIYELWRIARGQPRVSLDSFRSLPPSSERALLDRFRMLEPLLALLSPTEQELLERRFGMETLRWGKITAILLLAVGGLNALASLASLAAGLGGFGDALWLLAGAALSAEQIGRLRRLARGQPAGSVLGGLVRPLARNLLTR